MSKLGKKSIVIPKESTLKVEGDSLLVSGPKGSQKILFNPKIFSSKINEKNEFQILPIKKDKKTSLMWGTYRSLINNAIKGIRGASTGERDRVGMLVSSPSLAVLALDAYIHVERETLSLFSQ